MDDLTNVNREMAAALRALALAGPRPVSEYLESITSVVYWEGKSICGTGNDVSSRLREIVSQSRPC